MITPQLGVLWLLATWGHIVAAGLVAVLIAGQLLAMLRFLTNPRQLVRGTTVWASLNTSRA